MFRYRNFRNMSASERKYHIMSEAVPAGYKMGGNVSGKSLKAGMKVLAYYRSTNEGCDAVEILGVTDNNKKYGDGGPVFTSVKQMLDAHGCRSLNEQDDHDRKSDKERGDWGYHTYLYCKDLHHDADSKGEEQGAWYYIFEGRWARGSGAEKLSFVELIAIEPEPVVEIPNRYALMED